MKSLIKSSIIWIMTGFLIGEFSFGSKKDVWKLIKTDTYYFLQEGVYRNEEALKNRVSELSQKAIDKKAKYYYVYVGITKEKEVVEKIKNIYEKQGLNIYVKEKNVKSKEFSENVKQFDYLIKATSEEDEILKIEEVVLANYEEINKK